MPWIIPSLLLFGALASGLAARAEEARSPEGVERPFAEPGLGGFTKWLKKTGHDDPQGVFRLQDGMLRCGDEDMGYVARKRSYRDYRLSVEYRWGRKRNQPTSVRNTGVLLNAIGPDGAAKGLWMTSIECQLAPGL